jgi:tetratricopeptide (TPR) repeat protein
VRFEISTQPTESINHLEQAPDDPETLSMEHQLALNFLNEGTFQAAEELLRHDLAVKQNTLGATHADTLATMHNLGLAQIELGSYSDAERTYRELTPLYEKPVASLAARSNLGLVLNKQRKYDEAETLLRSLLSELRERFAADDPRVLGCLRLLMEAIGGQGRIDEALEMNTDGMKLVTKTTGDHQAAELEAMRDMRTQLGEWKVERS